MNYFKHLIGLATFIINVYILFAAGYKTIELIEKYNIGVNTYSFSGEVNPYSAEKLTEWLKSLSPGEEALLEIETYGGHLTSGFKIAHYLKTTKANLTCFVDSHAMSAGALMLGNCKVIKLTDNAMVLYHIPRYSDPTSEKGYRVVEKTSTTYKMFKKEILKHKFLTKEEIESILEGEDVTIPGYELRERLSK